MNFSILRRVAGALFLGVLIVMTTSCKKAVLRSQLKDLMASTIVLPEKISCVDNGKVFPMPDSLRNKAKLIVYIDSTECTSCRISHLGLYNNTFRISKESASFEVILLLANVKLYGIPLITYLSDMEIKTPVYVDENNKFTDLNPFIPADRRMHAFLVNDVGIPVCVGDPAISDKMLQVFLGAVNKLTN